MLKDGAVMIAAIVLTFLVSIDGKIGRVEGLILMLSYFIYYASLIFEQRRLLRAGIEEEAETEPPAGLRPGIFYIIAGFVVVILTSEITVDSTVALAERFGIPQSFIAIFIIGLGSSLPELAVSVRASLKGSLGLSLGNIIGSNIFDILIPMSLGAVVSSIKMEKDLVFVDLPYLFAISIFIIWLLTKAPGTRTHHSLLIFSLYVVYFIYKILFVS